MVWTNNGCRIKIVLKKQFGNIELVQKTISNMHHYSIEAQTLSHRAMSIRSAYNKATK